MAKIAAGKHGSKKEFIAKKAARLFKEKGYSATSMRDLADAIGVEAPSLYNHISGKKEILQEICFNVANLFTDHMDAVEKSEGEALEKIEKIIRFHIKMMFDEYESVYLSDHEWKHLPEPYLSNFKNQRRNYRLRLAGIIKSGMDANKIANLEPYTAVLTILSAVGGIESWQRSKKSVDAKVLEENMVKILIGGLNI